jgi:hypothetical protein
MTKSKDEMTLLTGRVLGGEIAPDVIVAFEELSQKLVAAEKARESAETEREDLRKAFFALATELVGADTRYSYDVKATGRRLQRVVVFGSPIVHYDRLETILAPEVFTRVVKKQEITTTTVTYELDYEALRDAINKEEITRAQLEACVDAGRVSCRLMHTRIKKGEPLAPEPEPVAPDPLSDLITW